MYSELFIATAVAYVWCIVAQGCFIGVLHAHVYDESINIKPS